MRTTRRSRPGDERSPRRSLAGIRRAQAAAEAGMSAAAELLRHAGTDSGRLMVDGEALTAESVRASCATPARRAARRRLRTSSSPLPGVGSVTTRALARCRPTSRSSSISGLMTRSRAAGRTCPDVRRRRGQRAGACDGGARARGDRAGTSGGSARITGRELYDLVCDVFEPAEYRTQRTEQGGPDGRFSVRARPRRRPRPPRGAGPRPNGPRPLVAGDVIAIEPGLWVREVGEVGSKIRDRGRRRDAHAVPVDLSP